MIVHHQQVFHLVVFSILGGSGITTSLSGTELTIATDGAIVTETSTDTLTNKTISG